MNNILKQIVEKKQKDLTILKQSKFIDLFKNELAIIGEIKLASPTVTYFGSEKDIVERAISYELAEIDAISVITEKHFFKGSPEFISRIKKITNIPILQKDFIIDSRQIYEAKIIGSDALLLIAKIVSKKTLIKFVSLCQEIGLEPVVEINDDQGLKKALVTSTKIIAVNARNLDSFEVNVERASLLMKKIPSKFIKLGFSGIKSSMEVKKYKQAGAKGILVGTALMQTKNIKEFIDKLCHSRENGNPEHQALDPRLRGDDRQKVKVKICGIRTLESAQTAIAAGADFLGFNFVPSSKRYIKPEMAKKIISQLKEKINIVGVFENAQTDYINKIVKMLDLDYVQLHRKKIIKNTKDNTSYLLVDRQTQGVGKLPNLNESETLAKSSEIFFAGGLNQNNVEEVIKKVHPFAVDVAGGIETNGVQDNKKIKKFITIVKGADI